MKKQAWARKLLLGCAAAVMMLTAGDSAMTQVVASDIGIDPLEVLSLTISPNVALIVDTSGSMGAPFNSDASGNNPAVGGDDFSSKMYQAKKALKIVIAANAGIANFGLLSYQARNASKDIVNENTDRYVRYVTNQTTAAYWTGNNDKPGIDATADFFGTGVTSNTGTSATNVYQSFSRFQYVLDMGTSGANCTNLAQCRWFLNSAYVRSNVRYTWSTAAWNSGTTTVAATTIDCSTDANRAPLGLFPDDPHTVDATKTDYARPCVQMANSAGAVTTFWYSSVAFENVNQCGGASLLTAVPGCMDNDPEDVLEGLKLQLPVDGSCQNTSSVTTPVGAPCGITPTGAGATATTIAGSNPALDPNAMEGLLAGGGTPLGPSLAWTNTNRATVFPNQVAGQPNYVILLTDGIDNCGGTAPATAAANLYANGITVFVVAMGINSATVDAIANAGSGGQFDAFSAQNPQELVNALSSIINQTASSGTFSAQPSATAWVFEHGDSAVFLEEDRLDPFNSAESSPTYRYARVVPATFQPLFEMPGFVGHLRAFLAAPMPAPPAPQVWPPPVQVWDAGDVLCRQITGFPATTGIVPSRCNVTGASATAMGNGSFTFAAMIGTNSGAPSYTQDSDARLKRRIFTTSRNGVFPYEADLSANGAQHLVPLWPPTTGVDPDYNSGTYPNGSVDVALGIAAMDFAMLQSTFGACRVSTVGVLHADCSVASVRESRARKEAREMILAYAAGAVVATTGGLPDRTPSTGSASVRGQILYKAKTWMLGDSTLSSAVAVTQPLRVGPERFHVLEYLDYQITQRSAARPRMSVVYLGANDMLHAFRAGPAGPAATDEQGGQELWGFVPHDQLAKLRLLLLEGQSSANHKYVIASGLRAADVFVPMPSTPGAGAWRTYLFFGRGIAGKHLTALDVSFPGDFTTPALQTTPPLAVWNRGNPDTQDGTAAGAANYLTNTGISGNVDLGVNDLLAYATMGQTWSTPALARVRTVDDYTDPTPRIELLELMLYAGSGYSNDATEGHNFYSIDPLTGDVITSTDVGSSGGSLVANAIPAPVAVFNPGQLQLQTEMHPTTTFGTQVYVGDLHGRLWKFPTVDPDAKVRLWDYGVNQPIATAVGLHHYNGLYDTPPSSELLPHIYLTTGNDRRVPTPPAEPADFLFVGVRDNEDPPPPDPIATELFRFTLPERYRGSTQPTTFWTKADATGGQAARVAVAVTRYNPISSASCRSSFDSRIYLVSAGLGAAAFDVNGDGTIDETDESWELPDEKVTGVRVSHGTVVVDKGLDPELDRVPPMREKPGSPMIWTSGVNVSGSSVCR